MSVKSLASVLAVAASLLAPGVASAVSGTYTVGGNTTGTGPWTLTATDSTFSVLRFIFDTPVKFADLESLSSSYDAIAGGIGGGAPRFLVVVDNDPTPVVNLTSFAVNWGPAGSFVDNTLGVGNTGNLLGLTDTGRYDLSAMGGSGYTDRSAALALAGGMDVHRVSLVLDTFGGVDRTFVIDGISVSVVPEPNALILAFASLGILAATRYRRCEPR